MKNIYAELKQRQDEILRLQTEVAALFTALPLLHESADSAVLKDSVQTVTWTDPGPLPESFTNVPALPTAPVVVAGTSWDKVSTRWP